jgi:dTDP-4-amino-4,6-dideoxygalactose transaminase
MTLPVFKPFIGVEELDACSNALNSKYLGMGSFVGDFERTLADTLHLGEDFNLVTFSTGHAALHLGLLALGIGYGDEVITPSFNNVADLQAIEATGAIPVFCDIEPISLCIDPLGIKSLITDRTKAIVAIDYGAALANHEALSDISNETGIPIFHDAAHSFGSMYRGQFIGKQAPITMFSFDPIKNITCIDGGALVFSDSALIEPLREMRMIGMTQRVETNYQNKRDWQYDVNRLGFRYHLPNLHAAIGIAQLRKLDEIRVRRRCIYEAYIERLKDFKDIKTQGALAEGVVPFIMCFRVPSHYRQDFRDFLLRHGIETGIHWRPGHQFSRYKKCRSATLPVTNQISQEIVSMPFYPELTDSDINFIFQKIGDFYTFQS